MNKYLKCIKTYCQELEDSGKIVPIEFTFPSFAITRKSCRKAVLDYAKDCVEIGLEGEYGNRKFDDNLSYENLLHAENSDNIMGKESIPYLIYLDKILPVVLTKDCNLVNTEINRGSLRNLCVTNMQVSFLDIVKLKNESMAYSNEDRSEYEYKKTAFVATLLMLKEQIPYAYKSVKTAMESAGTEYAKTVAELIGLEKYPDITVISHIVKLDPEFAMNNYPQQYKEINRKPAAPPL
jgi:hypothetical protein